ncbi:conserved hypothetical protein [Trichinella spiralis]|uniref:hypothetical protein n=1 Tax=Trichinella spiralis TaxID=6334 RepID=UPI0001EFD2D8|nr:conserved hypothetical protein [Trichinella spiralis]
MRTPVRRCQTLVIINQPILDHQKEYDANAEYYSLSDKFIFTVPIIILDEIDKLFKLSSEVIIPLLHFCLMTPREAIPQQSFYFSRLPPDCSGFEMTMNLHSLPPS